MKSLSLWLLLLLLLVNFAFPFQLPKQSIPKINRYALPGVDGKKFSSYVIYKGKAAVSLKLIPPTWSPTGTGKGSTVSREGGVFFEFAPTSGVREYDWTKKITFMMDCTECGDLIAKVNDGIEFLHDPNAQGEKAGIVTKKLKWAPQPDKKGLFLTLTVNDKSETVATSTSLSVPVSWGEFVVVDTIMKFGIPKFIGLDSAWDSTGGSFELPPPPPPPSVFKSF